MIRIWLAFELLHDLCFVVIDERLSGCRVVLVRIDASRDITCSSVIDFGNLQGFL